VGVCWCTAFAVVVVVVVLVVVGLLFSCVVLLFVDRIARKLRVSEKRFVHKAKKNKIKKKQKQQQRVGYCC